MKKILIVFGTRPEAIKLAPVIKEIYKHPSLKEIVCVFRQHDEMLDHVLKVFDIIPNYDLRIMLSDRALFSKGINIFKKIKNLIISGFSLLKFLRILKKEKPDILMVQGDTSTAFLAAFIGFHFKIPIAHIEAGLRTYDKYNPFPEEINRQLLSRLADLHFAPTIQAKNNLLKEGIKEEKVVLTGNTAIDALLMIKSNQDNNKKYEKLFLDKYGLNLNQGKKILLLTAHRRENFGEGLKNIFLAVKELAEKRKDIMIVYPIHLNPNVFGLAHKMLSNKENIFLIKPLEYDEFVFLMEKSYLILTDSGGIQEETSFLGKPILVMRKTTERPEGLELGNARLVGTDKNLIIKTTLRLLTDKNYYNSMSKKHFSFGDGHAAKRIVETIKNYLV